MVMNLRQSKPNRDEGVFEEIEPLEPVIHCEIWGDLDKMWLLTLLRFEEESRSVVRNLLCG